MMLRRDIALLSPNHRMKADGRTASLFRLGLLSGVMGLYWE
jgi:hypothetical protein